MELFKKAFFRIEAACGCNMGKKRTNNEDNFYFNGESVMVCQVL